MNYAAALVDFLDRDSQQIQRAMMYPITRIELRGPMSAQNPEGEPARIFMVGSDGVWIELSPSYTTFI